LTAILFSRGFPGSVECALRLKALQFRVLRVGVFPAGQQQHLLLGDVRLMLVIGADDALHQVMTHNVGFVEVNECQSFHSLQNVDRFQHPR